MTKISIFLELVVLLLLCSNIISALQDYHARYEDWKRLYRKGFGEATKYIDIAERKGNTFSKYSSTEKDAVAVVNLYTQEKPNIYGLMNNQYRNRLEENVDRIWRDFASLLNGAIDILLQKSNDCRVYKELYKGIDNGLPSGIPGTTQLKGFTSTSISARAAIDFGIRNDCLRDGCQVLLILYKAEGLYVRKYSHISKEDEVIIKLNTEFEFPSNSVFYRNNNLGRKEIDRERQRLEINRDVQILARGSPTTNRRRRAIKKYCVSDGNIFVPSYVTVVSFMVISSYTRF